MSTEPARIPFPFSLSTSRLALRSPAMDHARAVQEAVRESLAELIPWMPWAVDWTPGKSDAALADAIEEFRRQESFRIHAFDRPTGEWVASGGFPRVNRSVPSFEIGYWVRTRRTHCGFATEMARALTDYAFDVLAAERVEIRCSEANTRSAAVAERSGFVLEGILRNDSREPDGRLRGTRVYAVVRGEWGS